MGDADCVNRYRKVFFFLKFQMIFLFWLKKESLVEEIFDRLLLGNGYLHWPIGNGAILQGLHHHTR